MFQPVLDAELASKPGDPPIISFTPAARQGAPIVRGAPDSTLPHLGPAALDGTAIQAATAEFLPEFQQWSVRLTFTPAGLDGFNKVAKECHDLTAICPSGLLALVVDGKVVNPPRIEPDNASFVPFTPSQIQIAGDLTEASANALATRLQP